MSCKCTLAKKFFGDGCKFCNPALALEHLEEVISDRRIERDKLRSALMAAEQSLAIYAGIYGYDDGVNEILWQVRETLENTQSETAS